MIPRISVVIPTLNEAETISQAVCRAKALEPCEIIVADGGSCDQTARLARTAGCTVIESPPGRGIQLNRGAEQAAGDTLLFLHADNWLDPAAPAQIAKVLADPKIGGGGFRQRIDASHAVYRLLERGNALRATARSLFYGDQGIFVRSETFHRLGGFADVQLMEDVIFSRKLRRQSRMVLLPGPIHVSPRRWQQHGVVRQTLRNWMLVTALTLRVPPDRLARFYPMHG